MRTQEKQKYEEKISYENNLEKCGKYHLFDDVRYFMMFWCVEYSFLFLFLLIPFSFNKTSPNLYQHQMKHLFH